MDYREILYDVSDGVARIVLNRPEALNGLTSVMRAELRHAVARAGKEARATVLTGAGRGFCSGQDLGPEQRASDVDLERLLRDEYEPMLNAFEESPVPILCAVNGAAAGAGASLALACDVVVAARSAYFMQAFARIGLMPDAGGTWRAPRHVGLARAMGMALFADKIPADKAADWGLIWEVVEDDALEARIGELAAGLAKGPTRAFGAIRRAIRKSFENGYADQLALEAREQGALAGSRDFAEGVLAFLEKRKPSYEGR